MRGFRSALLCACIAAAPLALAVGAKAAEQQMPPGGMTLYNANGVPVAVLMPLRPLATIAAPTPADMPAMQMIAQQTDMMQRMMNDMRAMDNAMAADFAPADRLMQAVMHQAWGTGGALPGNGLTQVVISSFGGGQGSCSQTVTYRYDGNSTQPQVMVRKVGDACGSVAMPDIRTTPAALPPAQIAPSQPDTNLIRVEYRHPNEAPAIHG